jgi:hypothetical protein
MMLFLLFAAFLAACSPLTPETGPGVNEPTIEVSTAVSATEEPTPTAEIIEQPTPTIEIVEPAPTEEPTPTAEPEPDPTVGLCPDFPRPAMVLFVKEGYTLFNPISGESCDLTLGENVIGGQMEAVGSDYYVNTSTTGSEGEATIIRRISLDGTVQELPYTMADTAHGSTLTSFIVSPDGRNIAWGVLGQSGDGGFPSSSLSITNIETGETLSSVGSTIEEPRSLQPIRFSSDGSMLYYALQPYGIGGSWIAFVGRYDNLYAVPTDGSADPELLFDCAETGTGLCLGDFFLYENEVIGLAYVDRAENAVIILNGEGVELNKLTAEEEYIGYPTWGPGGEFVYYTANIDNETDGPPLPEIGILHRVVPQTAPAETLYSEPGLLTPIRYLNETQIIAQWLAEDGSWGLAIISGDGTLQKFDILNGASFIDIVQ